MTSTIRALVLGWCATLALHGYAQAVTYSIMYNFRDNNDGSYPYGKLSRDSAGNLYGTTQYGGAGYYCCYAGPGTVFRVAPDGSETLLHTFANDGVDGGYPLGGVELDEKGRVYGTTSTGGAGYNGVVFRLASDGGEEILHSFTGGNDGSTPSAGLDGFVGTTQGGGDCGYVAGCGTVFRIGKDGTETLLHTFELQDGALPDGGVIADRAGNLYGTTVAGGDYGYGTVFRLAPDGTETVLHSFGWFGDGAEPTGDLAIDSAGNLYGTTLYMEGPSGCGIVFRIAPDGTETILHFFGGGSDGCQPHGGVIGNRKGNVLFGTTEYGGTVGALGNGTVFEIKNGTETVIHSFGSGNDGRVPCADLISDGVGYLYGTTSQGGTYYSGTVFKISEK